jgi:hypothetical protein
VDGNISKTVSLSSRTSMNILIAPMTYPDLSLASTTVRRRAIIIFLTGQLIFSDLSVGHGGAIVADFLSKRFHVELGNRPEIMTNPQEALTQCWKSMDQKVLDELNQIKKSKGGADLMDGSTCTVMLMVGDQIYITNCGDSSAYAYLPSKPPTLLTEVHGTETASEVKRIVEAGGKFVDQVPQMFLLRRYLCLCM